jgi:hypothetical protein
MKMAGLLLGFVLLAGCETARRRNDTIHTVERWQVVTNALGHPKRVMVYREVWRDRNGLAFAGLFTDPAVSGFADSQTNQTALGGGVRVTFGNATSKTDSAGIQAAGGAVGDIVGAAVKTVAKP